MSDRFKDRGLTAKMLQEPDWKDTLKAWVFWVLKNPVNDDQEALAKAVNDLFALLGTKEAKIAKLERQASRPVPEVEALKAENEQLKELNKLRIGQGVTISSLKATEAALREENRKLTSLVFRLKALVDSPEMLVEWDVEWPADKEKP